MLPPVTNNLLLSPMQTCALLPKLNCASPGPRMNPTLPHHCSQSLTGIPANPAFHAHIPSPPQPPVEERPFLLPLPSPTMDWPLLVASSGYSTHCHTSGVHLGTLQPPLLHGDPRYFSICALCEKASSARGEDFLMPQLGVSCCPHRRLLWFQMHPTLRGLAHTQTHAAPPCHHADPCLHALSTAAHLMFLPMLALDQLCFGGEAEPWK